MNVYILIFSLLLICHPFMMNAQNISESNVTEIPGKKKIFIGPPQFGGHKAVIGEFPGMISLQHHRSHICGGTLINERHVVTAAHCVTGKTGELKDPHSFRVVGNDLHIHYPFNHDRQVRQVLLIFVHLNYNIHYSTNDIAVLRVTDSFHFSPTFKAVARSTRTPTPNTVCTIAGWGLTEKKVPSNSLLTVPINVIDKHLCRRLYSTKRLTTVVCAGDLAGGRDSCQGDSGGPLICDSTLAGIVSWGMGCALRNKPGVYTDVSEYPTFINWAMNWRSTANNPYPPTPTTTTPEIHNFGSLLTALMSLGGVAFLGVIGFLLKQIYLN